MTKIAHEVDATNKIGCMILAMPRYPLTLNPDDVWAALDAAHDDFTFGDVHCRDTYPRRIATAIIDKDELGCPALLPNDPI